MRDVPETMRAAWRSGSFTGSSRPFGRVTVQQAKLNLYSTSASRGSTAFGRVDLGTGASNLYASAVFDNPNVPKELPNIKSIRWDRDINADVATCSVEFYNTKALPLGQPPVGNDRDQPGYYTPTRGVATASSRWGHLPNEWQGMLLPDNVLRTFEGYGFDPNVCPEADPFLVQTGVWLIDDVQITSAGTIVASCRDLGRLLIDQIAMQPVVPEAYHPLMFEATDKKPGIRPPQLVEQAGTPVGSPADVPGNVVITPQLRGFTISWDAVADPAPELTVLPPEVADGITYRVPAASSSDGRDHFWVRLSMGANVNWVPVIGDGARWAAEYLYGAWADITEGQVGAGSGKTFTQMFGGDLFRYVPAFEVVGYRVYVDDRVMSRTIDQNTTSTSFSGLTNGVVYQGQVAAIYEELATGHRYTAPRSTALFFSPFQSVRAAVYPTDVESDTRADGTPTNGWIRWRYNVPTGSGAGVDWNVVLYQGNQGEDGIQTFRITEADVSTPGDFWGEFDTGVLDLHNYNILVFPDLNGVAPGSGGLLFAGSEHIGFFGSPGEVGEPAPPPQSDGKSIIVGGDDGAAPVQTTRVVPTYYLDSNHPYVGKDGSVYGHRGSDAFDGDTGTYWLSVGNSRPDVGYAYEWVEGTVPKIAVAQVEVLTHYVNMMCWVSIMVDGKWLAHDPGDIIPYDEDHPLSRNGADIPFVHAGVIPGGATPTKLTLRQVYGNVQRVRFTFSNLNDSDKGTYQYRAAAKEVAVHAVQSDGQPGETQPTATPVVDHTGAEIINASFITGVGANPGKYADYTDIVKLLCAWGGFFWPEDGYLTGCDGNSTAFNFGNAPYNLGPNIDPVLGGADAGRVWGDFENAGVAGIATLQTSIFDKKPLMEGINHIKNILGFLFMVDEEGGVVWRAPNIFKLGNWRGDRSFGAARTAQTVVIDERVNLLDLGVTLTSRNVREKVFVGSPDGSLAGVASGWNPNPVGLRRVGGWTDQNFETQAECQLMAELIALRQLFTYRTNRVQIPAYPKIQIDDQVQIFERVTGEVYRHYVKSISSSLDMESGEWTYELGTHWLGEDPASTWAFDPNQLSGLTTGFLVSTGRLDPPGEGGDFSTPGKIQTTFTFDEWLGP